MNVKGGQTKAMRGRVEERRAVVARLVLGRLSHRQMQVEIERQLGIRVGLTTIRKDVLALMDRWRDEQNPDDMERWRTQQNMSLDALERHCIKQQLQDGAKIADGILADVPLIIEDARSAVKDSLFEFTRRMPPHSAVVIEIWPAKKER